MIRVTKYIAIILVCAVCLVGLSRLRSCGTTSEANNGNEMVVSVPEDKKFQPVEHATYQPPSLPFSKKTSGFKLPDGVKERDVDRVVSVTTQPSLSKGGKNTIDVIETKDGSVFIIKDSMVQSVRATKFEQPVFALGLKFGIGASVALSGERGASDRLFFSRISPAGCVSFADWNIARLYFQAPVVTADLNGVGFGAQMQLYHNFYVGVTRQWGFDGIQTIKGGVMYMF